MALFGAGVIPDARATPSAILNEIAAAEWNRAFDAALLTRACADTEASVRIAAVRMAGRLRDARAVPALLGRLRDTSGPVRRATLFALGQIGDDSATFAIRGALPAMIRHDLPRALEALGKIQDPRAVGALTAHLRHADASVRGAAALAVFRMGDTSALPELWAAYGRETDAEARWRIVYGTWRLARDRARKEKAPIAVGSFELGLARASIDAKRSHAERVFAARALASIAGGRPHLLTLLGDPHRDLVLEAVRGSSKPWDLETARQVAALSGRDDSVLRDEVLTHLGAASSDKDKAEAASLLHAIGAEMAVPVAQRIRALELAAGFGAPKVTARPALGGTDEEFEELQWRVHTYVDDKVFATMPTSLGGRTAAALACSQKRVASKHAIPVLLSLLADADYVVRTIAIGGLAEHQAKDRVGAILAAARAATGTKAMDVRIEAAGALAKLKHFDPWLLHAASDDPDAAVRDAATKALEALGRKKPQRARRSVFSLFGHDAAQVRHEATALRGARIRFETTRGAFTMVLWADDAPAHCVNFAKLAEQGFYNGKKWHRVVGNFVIQGGCPRGDGWGGPGYVLPDEINTRTYVRGAVGMPKAGDDTGGCQVFVTHIDTPHLDGRYTVFAQVIEGLAVIDKIRVGDTITKATLLEP